MYVAGKWCVLWTHVESAVSSEFQMNNITWYYKNMVIFGGLVFSCTIIWKICFEIIKLKSLIGFVTYGLNI